MLWHNEQRSCVNFAPAHAEAHTPPTPCSAFSLHSTRLSFQPRIAGLPLPPVGPTRHPEAKVPWRLSHPADPRAPAPDPGMPNKGGVREARGTTARSTNGTTEADRRYKKDGGGKGLRNGALVGGVPGRRQYRRTTYTLLIYPPLRSAFCLIANLSLSVSSFGVHSARPSFIYAGRYSPPVRPGRETDLECWVAGRLSAVGLIWSPAHAHMGSVSSDGSLGAQLISRTSPSPITASLLRGTYSAPERGVAGKQLRWLGEAWTCLGRSAPWFI